MDWDWDRGSLNDIVLCNTIVTIAQLNVNLSIKIKNLNLVTYMDWKTHSIWILDLKQFTFASDRYIEKHANIHVRKWHVFYFKYIFAFNFLKFKFDQIYYCHLQFLS